MLKVNTNKEKFYYCACANWTSIIQAKNSQSAASKAMIEGFDKEKLDIEVSPIMMVKEIKENVKRVNYSVLYMKAVKALQEAMTRIETLETKVKALESK